MPIKNKLADKKGFICDMDGVIYHAGKWFGLCMEWLKDILK